MPVPVSQEEVRIHGHRVCYRTAGEEGRPVIVLVHGIAGSSQTWEEVMPALAREHLVIAPDLLGHGESAKPRGDYSLGAHASIVRDLLAVLGIERVTIAGHSLGGGIAMIFAYQYLERVDRLVLVSSGGLGREVGLALRALCVPGAGPALRLACSAPVRRALRRTPAGRSLALLDTGDARYAFLRSLRAVLDARGQSIDASDRLYFARAFPTLIAWGERDRMIPVAHAHAAAEGMPGSRLALFPTAGHYLHLTHADALAEAIDAFMRETEPQPPDPDCLRAALLDRPPAAPEPA